MDIFKVFDRNQFLEGRFGTVVADGATVTDDVEDFVVESEHLHFFTRPPEFREIEYFSRDPNLGLTDEHVEDLKIVAEEINCVVHRENVSMNVGLGVWQLGLVGGFNADSGLSEAAALIGHLVGVRFLKVDEILRVGLAVALVEAHAVGSLKTIGRNEEYRICL